MLPVVLVGVLLYFLMPNVMTVIRKAVVVLLVAGGLAAVYAVNGSDWGNVAVALVDGAYYIVDWLSDQFVSIWKSLTARF